MLRPSTTALFAILGVIGLTACEEAAPPTAPGTTSPTAATAAATSPALTLLQVSSGGDFTCAIAADSVPYCWGGNRLGELGQGDTTGPERCQIGFPGTYPC